jgi:2-amino-4-hydroxy-6-hydroxymethyldihydropteridine diphosphokinase
MTVDAFLGLGSNQGDRWRYLREAVESLAGVVAVSGVYETDPLGGPAGQGPYLNCVVELATALSPRELLGVCHRLESAAGRVRGERWGPRTLDVDVLLYGNATVDEPDLTIPHPRMWDRRFVLAPLAELAPERVSSERLARAEGRVTAVGALFDGRMHPSAPDR